MIFFTYGRLLLQINDEAENGRVEKHGERERKETTACFFFSLFTINHGHNVVVSRGSGQTSTLCL